MDAVREVCLKWKSACVLLHCNILSGTKTETPHIEKRYMKSQGGRENLPCEGVVH